MGEESMTRPKGWQQRLTAYLAANRARPASPDYDGFDFVAGAVEAMTGKKITRRETLEESFEDLPERERPRPGDVVILKGGAPGIWQGQRAYGLGPDGWSITVTTETPEKVFAV